MPAASATRFHRTSFPPRPRNSAHPSKNGRSTPRAGFVINARPHKTPYTPQSSHPSDSASSKVAHKIIAASSADSEVSQIHSNGIITPLGNPAHSHAAPAATPGPPILFPTKKSGTEAAPEKSTLSATQAKNARAVKT